MGWHGSDAVVKFTAAAALLACWAAFAATPYELECEARANPVGIDAERPRFSWKLKDGAQAAWQVQVGSAANGADMWDSGRVNSAETAWIPYGGAGLQAFHRYWWRVRLWGNSGAPSGWSDAAQWTQAPAGTRDWKGGWITYPDQTLRSGPLPLFRKEVDVDKPLRRALALSPASVSTSCASTARRSGDHVLAPAWTNYRATVYYETFDVTALLKTGRETPSA